MDFFWRGSPFGLTKDGTCKKKKKKKK